MIMAISNLASLCKTIGVECGAIDESRTRNPQSGNLMLYQLSYYGVKKEVPFVSAESTRDFHFEFLLGFIP